MNYKVSYMFLWRRITSRNHLPMHVGCAGHLTSKARCVRVFGAGAAPRREPAPRCHCPTRTCRSLRVATSALRPRRSRPCRLHKGVTGCGFCVRRHRCLPEQVPEWQRSRAGGPGSCGQIKGFPTGTAPVRRQRASHGSAELVPVSVPSLRPCTALGKQPE